jgi:hypothetical protein
VVQRLALQQQGQGQQRQALPSGDEQDRRLKGLGCHMGELALVCCKMLRACDKV